MGQVLAEETLKLLDRKGEIVVVALSPAQSPELKVQLDAFEGALQAARGVSVRKHFLDSKDPKYGLGRGLSVKRFQQVQKKHPTADAIVSLVGIPTLTDEQMAQCPKGHPKFIAEVRSPERCLKLLDEGVLQLAVVSRFAFPAPGPKHPRTAREWFDRYFQVITPAPGSATAAVDKDRPVAHHPRPD